MGVRVTGDTKVLNGLLGFVSAGHWEDALVSKHRYFLEQLLSSESLLDPVELPVASV